MVLWVRCGSIGCPTNHHQLMNEKHYHLHKEWILTSTDQEKALTQKHNDILERYNKSSKELSEIPIGSKVLIYEPSNRSIH